MSTVRVKTSRKETDYTGVSTIQKTFYDDGVDVVLRDHSGRVIRKIEMPRQAKVVYIMNDAGDTTDAIHWPIKPMKPRDEQDDNDKVAALRV